MENVFRQSIARELAKLIELPHDDITKMVEVPQDSTKGDYAFPCFTMAKTLKKSPKEIASNLAGQFHVSALFEKIEAVGPYVNFFVNRPAFAQQILTQIIKEMDTRTKLGKTVVIDFSSPNIAKPFSVGHLRSTVIGNSLSRIYDALGYDVVRINHLGDWGTQFGKLIVAYRKWGNEDELERAPIEHLFDLYVKFHSEAEKDPSLDDDARQAFKDLEKGKSDNLELWKRFSQLSLEEFKRIYDILGIEFHHYLGEQFYNQFVDETVQKLEAKNLTSMSDEALIVDLSEYNLPPCLIKKRDETTLYATRDIAAAIYRKEQFDFDKLIYVVGMPQQLHFKQVFTVLELMGYEWAKDLVHVDFGLIKFKSGMMSTRKGHVIFLEDVLDKSVELAESIIEEKNPELEDKQTVAKMVGVGAVIFADLSSKRVKDVEFDWNEVLNFDGETGPYVQYTHVRLCSILRKYGKPVDIDVDYSVLTNNEEFDLIRTVERFDETLNRAANEYEPSLVARYLIDLASKFNTFYRLHRVLKEDEPKIMSARLALVEIIHLVIKRGLYLLGIQAPEKM